MTRVLFLVLFLTTSSAWAVEKRVTELDPQADTISGNDVIANIDVSNTTQHAQGSSFKTTWEQVAADVYDPRYQAKNDIDIYDYGADPSGVTDSASAIANAVSAALSSGSRLVASPGTYRINSVVNTRQVFVDFGPSTIILGASGQLLAGGSSATTLNPPQRFYRVYREGGATSLPSVKVMGTKSQLIGINHSDYLQLYADTTNSATDGSIGYSRFDLGYVAKIELTNNPANTLPGAGDGGSVQWINENRFNIGRFSEFIISGTYDHNHNIIVGGAAESGVITLTNGWDNYFYDMRFEGGANITFGSSTERNTILNSFDTSTSSLFTSATVVDNGVENQVIDDFLIYKESQLVAHANISDPVVNNAVGELGRDTDLSRLVATSATSVLASSEYIPVKRGDIFRWISVGPDGSTSNTSARYRPRIEFFSATLTPVTASSNFIIATGSVLNTVSGNYISASTNVNAAAAIILPNAFNSGVRFARVRWYSNSALTPTISLATELSVFAYASKADIERIAKRAAVRKPVVVSSIPTEGFAHVGYVVEDSDGTAKYVNTFSLDTTCAAPHGATATGFTLGSGAGSQNGDTVGIVLIDNSTWWSQIASGGGTSSIVIADPLPSGSPANTRVVISRWATAGSGGGGITALLDDTTPTLGGNLNVNGQEVQSAGGIVLQLGDVAGVNSFEIEDSGSIAVFSVNSDGVVTAPEYTTSTSDGSRYHSVVNSAGYISGGTPVEGSYNYNQTDNRFEYYNGSTWGQWFLTSAMIGSSVLSPTGSAAGLTSFPGTLLRGPSGATLYVEDLCSGVSSPSTGDICLEY